MSGSEDSRPTWLRRMDEAKKKHRPSLSNWASDGFADKRRDDLQKLTMERALRHCNKIDRVQATHLSTAEFVRRYEEPALPVVIAGIPRKEGWKAIQGQWTSWDWLRTQYGDRLFKVGEDDDGYKVKVKLKYFMSYLYENKDDSPLYVFDGAFDDDDVSKSLLSAYEVPPYFREDLFSFVGEDRRPPYRWWLLGPARSGTCVHIDPLGTSAWNTLLVGRKRWVLFPPSTHKRIAKALCVIREGEDDEAVNYFVDHLPRLLKLMKSDERDWKEINSRANGFYVCADCNRKRPTGGSLSSFSGSARTTHESRSSGRSSSNSSCSSSTIDSTGSSSERDQAGKCSYCGDLLPTDPYVKYGCSSGDVMEFTQYPGETIFVPGYWWHAVLNMDDTVAITQNFCSSTNFANVWRETRSGRKKMSCKWLKRLREHRPDLADQAEKMNKDDNFLMYYERRKLKEEKRAERREEKARMRELRRARKLGVATSADQLNEKVPPPPSLVSDSDPVVTRVAGVTSKFCDAVSVSVSGSERTDDAEDGSKHSRKTKKKKNFKHESKYSAQRREAKRKLHSPSIVTDSSEDSSVSDMTSLESVKKKRKKSSSKGKKAAA